MLKQKSINKCRLCKLACLAPGSGHKGRVVLDDAGLCEDCQQLPRELLFEWLVKDARGEQTHMTDFWLRVLNHSWPSSHELGKKTFTNAFAALRAHKKKNV